MTVYPSDYWRARRILKALGNSCGICGHPIDYDLRWPHPWSFTADHILEVDRGGEHTLDNLRAAHVRCNLSRGATHGNTKRTRPTRRPQEREW